MRNKCGKSALGLIMLVCFFVIIIILLAFNRFMKKNLESIQKEEEVRVVTPIIPKQEPVKKYIGKVVRKTRWDPSRKYEQNLYYAGDEIIARSKSIYDTTIDFSGDIPDGRVKFIDQTRNTTGEEYYLENKRNGSFREYYENGQLRVEAKYRKGKLMTRKEYFVDGILRQEEDYTDAMWITQNKEVGEGKVYNRDGILKYEWSLTNSAKGGYNRSYNNAGELIDEKFLDQNGNLIEKK